ncbi:MAG: YdeI/OmpD-associated family protein [Candidatus Riflebacteria bacterium]|nr:YdeI/OmpD-associated family protein [Candidatus Riflebacteria bacterium]
MTQAGLATINPEILAGSSSRIVDQDDSGAACAFLEAVLKKHPKALENFRNLAPSHRKHYGLWVTSAKKDETRQRRLEEAIGRLERNEKLGMK